MFINEVLPTSPSPFGPNVPQSFYGNSILPADAEGTGVSLRCCSSLSAHSGSTETTEEEKHGQPVHSHLTLTVNNCHVLLECVFLFQEIIMAKKKVSILPAFQHSSQCSESLQVFKQKASQSLLTQCA